MSVDAQTVAADPDLNIFLAANAGTGKTRTLVSRVARLLLRGARPEAVLCVTYTKAAAAEMQRRLFTTLGDWAVMDDRRLAAELRKLGEPESDLSRARRLFALALETPGGLKVQTIHAFCERLLRRFPLEAGVSPRFQVLEDAAALAVAAQARDAVARLALTGEGAVAAAYARLSISLDPRAFDAMFACFDAERDAVSAYLERCGGPATLEGDVWRRCGFPDGPTPASAIEREATAATGSAVWRAAARALLDKGGTKNADCAGKLLRTAELLEAGEPAFSAALEALFTKGGEGGPRDILVKDTGALAAAGLRDAVLAEVDRFDAARAAIKGALVAEDTVAALTLALAYAGTYARAKAGRGALDFADLIARTKALLTVRADAAWVLYKLDGGVDHVLVDEAQDTAPEQWDILRALTAEFFAGDGPQRGGAPLVPVLPRTVFAVGDEKQSIYSFQGARPERLLAEARAYNDLVTGARREFRTPELDTSWRSTPQVLRFVDAVFEHPAAKAGVRPQVPGDPPASEQPPIHHETVREAEAGSVELWPLLAEAQTEDPDPWRPLDVEAAGSGRKRLAEGVAGFIKAAVARGDAVGDRSGPRPVGYGDFLVLVQRRDPTFEEVIRACKLKGVPVAGADRLTLSEHIAFHDLLGLIRFVLFPGDDLTLAALLRSPFCDIDEDGLYALAQGRGRHQRLWRVLRDRAGERPEWTDAVRLLEACIGQAADAPFEFLARVLERTDRAGRSVRARFLTRLGAEARDALDETLAQALAAEARGIRDLESFAAAMAEADVQVKRELEEPRGQVRVMTVHGAKGLEAPVVILPDTTARPRVDGPALLKTADGAFLWCSSKKADCRPSEAARLAREQAKRDESMRLFYVALTRARDRLILCGRLDGNQSKSGRPAEDSWYALAETALSTPKLASGVRELEGGVRRFGPDPLVLGPAAAGAGRAQDVPDWLTRPPAQEARRGRATPTGLGPRGGGAPSPLTQHGGLGRFRRGDLIHKLLELLPDLPPDEREGAALAYLAKQADLDPSQRAEMAEAALRVIREPAFAAVFGPGSRAEAALAGAAPGLPSISGRVDRLVVGPDAVLVVDFKTNRSAPATVEAADPAYLDQMAAYIALLRAVFPGKTVEAALLWTDGPRLMPIPAEVIEARLQALRAD